MARGVKVVVVVADERDGVGFRRRDEEIMFADDAVWTRGVRKGELRWSKTR